MGNKYTVVGNFRQPHKDCEGETLTDLSFEEVMKIESEWKKEKKYKEVFHFKRDKAELNRGIENETDKKES